MNAGKTSGTLGGLYRSSRTRQPMWILARGAAAPGGNAAPGSQRPPCCSIVLAVVALWPRRVVPRLRSSASRSTFLSGDLHVTDGRNGLIRSLPSRPMAAH